MELYEIGKLIREQDNRSTDAPIFIVQKLVRVYGMDSEYSDKYVWVNPHEDYHEACGRLHDILDRREDLLRSTFGYEKQYYTEKWEYVNGTSCFTEQGCKGYLARNDHNIRERTRIYADGSYRNNEFREVRQKLIELSIKHDEESANG